MKCGHLFNGIGGFALAAHWMGWQNVMHCEIDPFCNRVMNYHFPKSKKHEDIRNTDFSIYRGHIDVLTGGFPCQPYSTAGKRKGKEDDRHLWPEMLRAIREIQPGWIVGENVRGIVSWNGGMVFDEVQADLEAAGYEVLPFLLPAASVNAPHRRDRIWFVAHSDQFRRRRSGSIDINERRQPLGFNGEGGAITHTNGSGFGRDERPGQTGCEEETVEGKEQRQGWDEVQRQRDGSLIRGDVAEGVTSNAGCGIGNRREDQQGFNEHNGQDGGGAEKASEPERLRAAGSATHSPIIGEREQANKVDSFTEGGETRSELGGTRGRGVIANTAGSGGLQDNWQGEPGQFDKTDWQNFPTQSPVCSGNDGLPAGLVPVTVSGRRGRRTLTAKQAYGRIRKESLKAAGNAIVPQVAFQIFKAIEAYENY